MKKIAIVIDGLTGGGAERVMLTLAEQFIELGHQVSLLSLGNLCDYSLPKGMKYFSLFDHKASKVDRPFRLKNSIKKLEHWFEQQTTNNGIFDLVLSNLDRSNNLLAKSKVNNVFYVVHNSINEELNRQKKLGPLAYFYLKKSKRNLSGKNLIAVSKGIENEINQSRMIKPQSVTTIYNPFKLDEIIAKSEQPFTDKPKHDYVIHVGRLAKQKRHDVLFQAFQQVPESYKLVLLCNKKAKAKKLAKKYGIEKRLILPGFQDNPYQWIKKANLLVLSSDYEGFGNVLAEAIAVGTKVVSTKCPHGPDEILSAELAKYLVPRRNPQALALAMNNALQDEVTLNSAEILTKIPAELIAKQYLSLI